MSGLIIRDQPELKIEVEAERVAEETAERIAQITKQQYLFQEFKKIKTPFTYKQKQVTDIQIDSNGYLIVEYGGETITFTNFSLLVPDGTYHEEYTEEAPNVPVLVQNFKEDALESLKLMLN